MCWSPNTPTTCRRSGAGNLDFVERLWQTIKYEEVYLRAYASIAEARAWISYYLRFYNGTRRAMPDQAYLNRLAPIPTAA